MSTAIGNGLRLDSDKFCPTILTISMNHKPIPSIERWCLYLISILVLAVVALHIIGYPRLAGAFGILSLVTALVLLIAAICRQP